MTERHGWYLVAAFAILGTIVIGGPATTSSRTGEIVAVGLTALCTLAIVALVVHARRRAGATVPAHLRALDADERRLVVASAERGERATSPRLAEAVVAHARRTRSVAVVMILAGILPVGTRVAAIAAGETDAGTPVDVAVMGAWSLAAVYLAGAVRRAGRSIAANRPPRP